MKAMDAPGKLWLQWWGDDSPDDGEPNPCDEGATWCADKIFEHDVLYIRTDIVKAANTEPPADMTCQLKALAILRELAQMAADGKSLTIAPDWGFGTATIIDGDGNHTHVGRDIDCNAQESFETFVEQLHLLLIGK